MKHFTLPICLIIIFLISGCSIQNERNQYPNIIYVLADDLGYGDISIFNEGSKISTPNIDRLAIEGIQFTDAHTSSAVCTPTRYGIITGRYNWRSTLKSGVLTGTSKALIPNSRTTVARLLKKNDYKTAFIGKWHLGWDWALRDTSQQLGTGWNPDDFSNIDFSKPVKNGPKELGFDYSYGHSGSLDMAPYVYVENGMPTQIPDSFSVNTGKYSWWREGPTSDDFVHTDVTPNFFRKSFKYIKEMSKQDKPFFLYLALPSPHTPILPGKQWQGKSGLNPYGDFVMMIDDYVGQLQQAIAANGIEENTLVIFTSDNGCSPAAKIDELIEKGHHPSYIFRGHKADIFEGGHRVPFIAKWPGRITPGSISSQTVCTTDLMATCADIVDSPLADDEGEDSFSMLPLFDETSQNQPIRAATVHHSINGSFAIRKDSWKLSLCPGSGGWSYPRPENMEVIDTLPKYQLYNLETDPGESNNLYLANPEKADELKALLTKYIVEGRSTPGVPQQNDPIDFDWQQVGFINE